MTSSHEIINTALIARGLPLAGERVSRLDHIDQSLRDNPGVVLCGSIDHRGPQSMPFSLVLLATGKCAMVYTMAGAGEPGWHLS